MSRRDLLRLAGYATTGLALGAAAGAPAGAAPDAHPMRRNHQVNDNLLKETVGFAGMVFSMQSHVPALVLGAVRDGESAVFGFGETSDGSGKPPDGQTILRIGSLTKAFAGQVLASLVADGTVRFTDRLQDRLGWDVTIPTRGEHQIRLIDMATHSSGLPREVERESGPPDDPFSTLTPEAHRKALASDPLVYAPGTARCIPTSRIISLVLRSRMPRASPTTLCSGSASSTRRA